MRSLRHALPVLRGILFCVGWMRFAIFNVKGGSMKKVRLGLIGMGMIGKLHAETMSKMKDLEFVAACDVDTKHRKTAEELGTKYYQSYEEMIGKEKLDGL